MLSHGQDVSTRREWPLPVALEGSLLPQGVWDTGTLAWVKMTQPGGVGGGGLTDAQLRATPVPVSGGADHVLTFAGDKVDASGSAVTANAGTNLNTASLSLEATQALVKAKTDNLDVLLSTRLKPADTLAAVTSLTQMNGQAISMGTGLRAAGTQRVTIATDDLVPVSGPLTDAQLRATPVPVSGSVTANAGTNLNTAALNLEATQALVKAKTDNLDVLLSTRLKPADTLAGVTTVGAVTAITNALPVGANIIGSVNGDVDHDVINTLKQIQIGGHASPVDVPPTAVSANGDRVRAWFDRYGTSVVRRRKIRETYTAVFRLGEAAARLDQTFTHVANTNKQWATIHHTAGATKECDLVRLVCYITAWSAASQAVLELRSINAAPATGNPAITPAPRRFGGGAAEAVCLYLPTTAGTEVAVNSPLASIIIDEGIMGAASVANPLPAQQIVLYSASNEDDEALTPTLPVATLSGWAVMLRTVGTPAVRMTVEATFTEEIP